jgi:hypothetical protein
MEKVSDLFLVAYCSLRERETSSEKMICLKEERDISRLEKR